MIRSAASPEQPPPPKLGSPCAYRAVIAQAMGRPAAVAADEACDPAADDLAPHGVVLGALLPLELAFERMGLSRSGGYRAIADGTVPSPIYRGRRAFLPEVWVDALILAEVREQLSTRGTSEGAPQCA